MLYYNHKEMRGENKMKIFAHDGMIINLETVASIEKSYHFDPMKRYYLIFRFIGKNEPLDAIRTSSFSDEKIIDGWLAEISETMTKNS
jgi:hypothetical protein